MIIDIDNKESVQAAMERISKDWFDPAELYNGLKTAAKTDSLGFWCETAHMLADVSSCLGLVSDRFLAEWNQRCIDSEMKLMGYHCTRHSDKGVFREKGILPLSEETVKLNDYESQTAQRIYLINYRYNQSPGPSFFLSYNRAKKPDNHFFNGPEILLACDGHHVGVDNAKSFPLIIHCAIPYSLLSVKDYFAFCILRAYFNFLNPEDGSENFFDGYSIDLRGKALDPKHIVKIEKT